jgi:hypothetical protein
MENCCSIRSRCAGALVVFVLAVLVLMPADWHTIREATIENGDSAANSLLIQEAKHFRLLTGNYSRVGFNHPGPALLYVLALGEFVFYDTLKVTPYPMGGQLMMVVIYSAFWIAVIWSMLARMWKSRAGAALMLGIFLGATALFHPNALCGMWFPYLYYFPFAVFVLAASQLVIGRSAALPALAVSWGFLVNGHVSFVAITGIILVCTVLANLGLAKFAREKPACLLSRKFLVENKVLLLFAFLVMALFLLPLAIETALHFPGPVAKYYHYSKGNRHNALPASLVFVGVYWGGVMEWIAGTVALGLVCLLARGKEYFAGVLGITCSLAAATLGFLFYAVVGVDDLLQTYVGLFFYSVPAICLALIAYVLYARFLSGRGMVAAMLIPALVVVACAGFVFSRARYTPFGLECDPAIPALLARMQALEGQPVVLDLDNENDPGNDWGHVWSTIAGVETYAKRQGTPLLLVRKGWHILFTNEARYSPAPPAPAAVRYLVTTRSVPGAALAMDGLWFYRVTQAPLADGTPVAVTMDNMLVTEQFLGDGWFLPEKDFAWSEGKVANLLLLPEIAGKKKLCLDVAAFIPTKKFVQHVKVTANDMPLGEMTFTADQGNRGKRYFDLPDAAGKPITVKFLVENPVSPLQFRVAADTRLLGIGLYGFELTEEK